MADAAPGRFFCGLGASSQVIVANWNGLAFENQYRRVRGHAAVPAHGLQRREGDRGLRDLQGQGFPAGPDPRAAAAHLPGRAAPRHAAPGRAGGRRGHPQLAQRRGRRHIGGGGGEGGRRGAAGDRRPHLRDRHRGRQRRPHHGAAHDHRLPERGGLRRVPPLARPGSGAAADVGRLGRRRPQGGAGRPSPTRWWTSSWCTGRWTSAGPTSSATSTTASPSRPRPSSRSGSTWPRPSPASRRRPGR